MNLKFVSFVRGLFRRKAKETLVKQPAPVVVPQGPSLIPSVPVNFPRPGGSTTVPTVKLALTSKAKLVETKTEGTDEHVHFVVSAEEIQGMAAFSEHSQEMAWKA